MQTTKRLAAIGSLLILCAIISAWKPVPNQLEQYKNELREICDKINRSAEGRGNSVAYLNATVISMSRMNGEVQRQRSSFEMIVSSDYMRWLSKDIKMFRDEKATFMVFTPQKTIQCIPVGMSGTYESQFQTMSSIQDQIFEWSEVEECEIMQRNGVQVNRVTLKLSKAGINQLHIHHVHFEYEPESGKLLLQQVEYDKNQPLSLTRMEYHEMNMNYKDELGKNDASSFVFDKKGSPLPAYQDYKIFDNRTSK